MNEGEHMMRRVHSLSAALLCSVLACLMLTGCFGSSEEPTTITSASTATSVSSSASTTTTAEGETTTTEGFELVNGVPKAFYEAFGQRPIVVVFYVPGGIDDEKVLKSVQESVSVYANYTFLTYDYSVPAEYGDLSKALAVGYPPQVVLIDRNGIVRTVWTGFVDKGTLNQTLLNLGKY